MANANNLTFKAFRIEEVENGYKRGVKTLTYSELPSNEILVKVEYSSLNYKDALSAIGNKGVTKHYPHTPGIDAAGIVIDSISNKYKYGDKVVITGYDLGMNTDGGFGQYISVPEKWVIKLPDNLSLLEAMIIGTAGFTAGISILNLIEQVQPTDGKVIVTGATGGVGSVSVNILSKLGYKVVAVSGKKEEYDYLKNIGAAEIIDREEFFNLEDKPILSAKYAGGIDTVGGKYLENIIKSLYPLGRVTTCGSVASTNLNLSVFPFILRGISLVGISAQNYPMEKRQILWNKLADEWKPESLIKTYSEISLEELNEKIDLILAGKLKGRTVINLWK